MRGLRCAEGCHRAESRWWTYPRGEWSGWRPSLGDDEYHCRTLVLTGPGLGALIVQLWHFNPAKCDRDDCATCEIDTWARIDTEEGRNG